MIMLNCKWNFILGVKAYTKDTKREPVKSEFFTRILYLRITLKDTFAILKIHARGMIYLYYAQYI